VRKRRLILSKDHAIALVNEPLFMSGGRVFGRDTVEMVKGIIESKGRAPPKLLRRQNGLRGLRRAVLKE